MSKLKLTPTEGNALNTQMVRGTDNLHLDSPFFGLGFLKENPAQRAGVVLEIEPEAQALLERELKMHMNPDSPNFRAILQLNDNLAVQVMMGGIATYSDADNHTFEVDVLSKDNKGEFKYWTKSPFLEGAQVGEFKTPEEVDEIMRQIRAYTGSIARD